MTDHYAVVGNPIAHSKSPDIHAAFAAQTGQDMDYRAKLLPEDGFENGMQGLMAAGLRGFNVTLPFKTQAVALADHLDPLATLSQAVNTLALSEDGTWVGYNTDGMGLVTDLLDHCQQALKDKRILVLGAGGAVRGVLPALLKEQPHVIHLLNRTHNTAMQVASDCGGCVSAITKGDLLSGYDLIINGTSASLSGQMPDLPTRIVGADTGCYDMMYGKTDTPFMIWAREQGATQVWDGMGMLVEQAAAAFYIWRGKQPVTAPIRALLKAQLSA